MMQFNKSWFLWLTLICIWNFGWPNVHPLADVVVAVILSVIFYQIKKKKK